MKLSKNEVLSALTRTGITIGIINPFSFLRLMGPQGMFCEASYMQRKTGPYQEAIILSPFIFRAFDLFNAKILRVLFHELGHATGNHARLNRSGVANGSRNESDLRLVFIEELIAERTAQKLMTHFDIFDGEVMADSNQYIQLFVNRIQDKTGCELSEIETYRIERESDLAFDFVLTNWFNETNATQKAA